MVECQVFIPTYPNPDVQNNMFIVYVQCLVAHICANSVLTHEKKQELL